MVSNLDLSTRSQIVALKALGKANKDIATYLRVNVRTVQKIYRKALERGYNPEDDPRVLSIHIEDTPRSGRPRKQEDHQENVIASM